MTLSHVQSDQRLGKAGSRLCSRQQCPVAPLEPGAGHHRYCGSHHQPCQHWSLEDAPGPAATNLTPGEMLPIIPPAPPFLVSRTLAQTLGQWSECYQQKWHLGHLARPWFQSRRWAPGLTKTHNGGNSPNYRKGLRCWVARNHNKVSQMQSVYVCVCVGFQNSHYSWQLCLMKSV